MKGESFFALIAGAAAGLALGLLFAPEKGEDTRRKVKNAAEDGWDKVKDSASEGWDEAKEAYGDFKEDAVESSRRLQARARLARMDLKDLKATLKDQTSDLKEEARIKILEQLEKLEKALQKEEDDAAEEV